MVRNTLQALKEHKNSVPFFLRKSYGSPGKLFLRPSEGFLSFSVVTASKIGPRDCMEDAYFFLENNTGLVAGLFDGHNGREVARFAAERMEELFFPLLEKHGGDPYCTLYAVFSAVQAEIEEKHPDWEETGSTAVVCYIDKRDRYVYTATLGDSEADLYRKIGSKRKSFPLCCIRNWSTKRDADSARKALGEPIPLQDDPKQMRHPPRGLSVRSGFGLNVSRALGDAAFLGVIHTPKITVAPLRAGDLLLLSCDGLKDAANEREILSIIEIFEEKEGVIPALVDYALSVKNSTDNVSVLGVFVR